MSDTLPLPPAIAYGLPWRVNFQTKRPPAILERFADKAFVASLTPDERKHAEAVISARLAKLLAGTRISRTLSRAHVNRAASQAILEARAPAGLKVSLGTTRLTVSDAVGWIGGSVPRLLEVLRPDPGTRQPEFSGQFGESDWQDVGLPEPAPSKGSKATKPKSVPVKRPDELELSPPTTKRDRRKRQNDLLKLRSPSGHTIHGNDYRLGWLLFEAHKIFPLDRPELSKAAELIAKLGKSRHAGAPELAAILQAKLSEVEGMDITQEIRGVLSELIANAQTPGPWTEERLFTAFGVAKDGKFDPRFWSAAATAESLRLRRRLVAIAAPFHTAPFYSPAFLEFADTLASLNFIGSRHLEGRLSPQLGKSHIVGVAKFMTDVVDSKLGRMDNVPVSAGGTSRSDLFFWNQDTELATALEVCERARDLTAVRGAFSFHEILEEFGDRYPEARSEALLREILNEWSAVRWLDQPDFGVVLGASPLVAQVEQMLAVAWPNSLALKDVAKAVRALRGLPAELRNTIRKKIRELPLVDDVVLMEALPKMLEASDKVRRAGRSSIALAHKPETDYWKWRPVERDLVAYLKSVGGSAPNLAILQHFKSDRSVERVALEAALRALPYLYAPTPLTTAVWPWVMPEGA